MASKRKRGDEIDVKGENKKLKEQLKESEKQLKEIKKQLKKKEESEKLLKKEKEELLQQREQAEKEIEDLKKHHAQEIVQCPPLTTAHDGDEIRKSLLARHASAISHIAFVKALDALAKDPSSTAKDLATVVFDVLAVCSDTDRQVGVFSRPSMKASASASAIASEPDPDRPSKKSRYTKKDQGRLIEEAMTSVIGSRFGRAISCVEDQDLGWLHQAVDISGASPDLVLFNTRTLLPYAFVELGEGSVPGGKETQLFTYAVNALHHDCGNTGGTSEKDAVNRAVLSMAILFLTDGTPKAVQLYGSCLMAKSDEYTYNKVSQVLLFQEMTTSGDTGVLRDALARCFQAVIQHGQADGYPTQSRLPHNRPTNAALHDNMVYKWYPSTSSRTSDYMCEFLGAEVLELASGSKVALKGAVIVQYNWIKGTHTPETVGHVVEIARQLLAAHKKRICHADVRGLNMVFAILASNSRLIDWDYAVKCGTDGKGLKEKRYPLGYRREIEDGGRDDDACGDKPIHLKHDLVGLCKFAEKFEPEEAPQAVLWRQAVLALTTESGLQNFIDLFQEAHAVKLRCTDEKFKQLLSSSLPPDTPKVLEGTGSPLKMEAAPKAAPPPPVVSKKSRRSKKTA